MPMFDEPSYLVQIGHNGHLLVDDVMEKGYADGAILSPADYNLGDNEQISKNIRSHDGVVLFDPQFYIPRSDRPKFESYDYHQEFGGDEFDTATVASESEALCRELINLQDDFFVDAYVAPARVLDAISDTKVDEWKELTGMFLHVAEEEGRDIPVFASLPLDYHPLTKKNERNKLLNHITRFDVDGFYVSAEFDSEHAHPLTGSSNVYSMLDLLNGLKNNHYNVIVGHTHQVAHLYLGIGVDVFASGHYVNLRSFDTRRWDPDVNQSGGRQVVKYYSDKLLNELRVDQDLDLMYQKDDFDIETIRTPSDYDDPLFGGSDPPSTVGWSFRNASWDHYIWSCFEISRKYRDKSLEERFETAETSIEEAAELYDDVTEQFGLLTEPTEEIYSDWRASLSTIKSDVL